MDFCTSGKCTVTILEPLLSRVPEHNAEKKSFQWTKLWMGSMRRKLGVNYIYQTLMIKWTSWLIRDQEWRRFKYWKHRVTRSKRPQRLSFVSHDTQKVSTSEDALSDQIQIMTYLDSVFNYSNAYIVNLLINPWWQRSCIYV